MQNLSRSDDDDGNTKVLYPFYSRVGLQGRVIQDLGQRYSTVNVVCQCRFASVITVLPLFHSNFEEQSDCSFQQRWLKLRLRLCVCVVSSCGTQVAERV